MAVYTFKHAFVGKSGSAPGTASAHVNYISRKSATCYQEAVGIASKPRQTHANATWRFLKDREESIRRNGRVCDKFIIAVPVEMTQQEAIGLLRRFGHKIGCRYDAEQKRLLKAPFFFTLQDWGTHNPHAHFVFVDADRESGERVFGTTKKGSTDRLRAAWEETANAELERFGYEARIDRRPQRVIDAELEVERVGPAIADGSPEVHTERLPEGETMADDIDVAGTAPPEALTSPLEDAHAQAQESADHIVEPNEKVSEHLPDHSPDAGNKVADPEPDMANSSTQQLEQALTCDKAARIEAGSTPVSVAGKVKGAHQLGLRAEELQTAQRRLQTALRWSVEAAKAHDDALRAHDRLETEKGEFEQHRGWFGKPLAGFVVFGWKTPDRRAAEKQQSRVMDAQSSYKTHYEAATYKGNVARQQEEASKEDRQRIEGYERMTPDQKQQALENMQQAADIIAQSRDGLLSDLSGPEIFNAYQNDELTAEEAIEACERLGFAYVRGMIEKEAELEEQAGIER